MLHPSYTDLMRVVNQDVEDLPLQNAQDRLLQEQNRLFR